MIRRVMSGALAAILLMGTPALADSHEQDDKADKAETHNSASIPFADLRGQIRDWRDEGRTAILIEGNSGQWYRAEFMSPCHGLPFTETIGFVLDGTNQVDKFGSIIVRSAGGMTEECWFKSFEKIPDPDKKTKKDKQGKKDTK